MTPMRPANIIRNTRSPAEQSRSTEHRAGERGQAPSASKSGVSAERAAHTPGPWEAVVDEQLPERGRIYVQACGRYDAAETIGEAYKTDADVDDGGLTETEANALLFAAAPDLATAVRALLAVVDCSKRNADEAIRAGCAALAKAEGRS